MRSGRKAFTAETRRRGDEASWIKKEIMNIFFSASLRLWGKGIGLLGLVFLPSLSAGQVVYPDASDAFPILLVGVGARAAGMGESFTAVADDLSALHYNPAGLGQIRGSELSILHNSYLDDGFHETLAGGFSLPRIGTLALGLGYVNYGTFQKRDPSGNLLGTYRPFDLSLQSAFGFALEKDLYLGMGSQWIRQEVDGSVHTVLLWNGGVLFSPFERFTFGLDLRNLGVETGTYGLPTELTAGVGYRLSLEEDLHCLLLSGGGGFSFDGPGHLNLGFEYAYQQRYFLRAGYSRDLRQDPLGWAKGLSFGLGLKLGQFTLDYAYCFMGELGDIHRLGLSLSFPEPAGSNRLSRSAPTYPAIRAPEEAAKKPVLLKFQVSSQTDMTAEQLFDQGEEKWRMGLKQEALDFYLRAVGKDPNLEKAWNRLGKTYFDKSLESYRKALEADPGNDQLRQWLNKFKP